MDYVVTVKHFVIDVDGLKEFIFVKFKVSRIVEDFLAVRTRDVLHEPAVDAVHMIDMITA